MSTLTKKQSEEFVEFYRWLYGETNDLPNILEGDYEWHRCLWRQALTEILGKSTANRTYTHKGGRTEKYVDFCLSWLWLSYGPTVLDNEGNVSCGLNY